MHFFIYLSIFFANISILYALNEKYKSLSPAEIQDLVTKLWFADRNRVKLNLDFQNKLSRDDKNDKSPQNFMRDQNLAMLTIPSVQKMMAIFDVYKTQDVDQNLLESRSKDFLEILLKTDEFNILRNSLRKWGYASANSDQQFKNALYEMWFDRYPRKKVGALGSSGFQHVFVGEIDRRAEQVLGLHNWLRYRELEQRGDIDYTGYVTPGNYVAAIRYRWKGNWKNIGSMFIGTSPEFDMAVYTLCFLTKPGMGRCSFVLEDCMQVKVSSSKFQSHKNSANLTKNQIGTVFPEVGKVLGSCDIRPPVSLADEPMIVEAPNSTSFLSLVSAPSIISSVLAANLARLVL